MIYCDIICYYNIIIYYCYCYYYTDIVIIVLLFCFLFLRVFWALFSCLVWCYILVYKIVQNRGYLRLKFGYIVIVFKRAYINII